MPAPSILTPDGLLGHWLGHRRLTRRTIEAFPDDETFSTFSIGGMRTFSSLVNEFLATAEPTLRGIVTGEWPWEPTAPPATRAEALQRWDAATVQIEALWAEIPADRFGETVTAFGRWTMPVWAAVLYILDNEVHHRGQGYVYLRALGVEPPAFPERD
ncbi:MAG TPA: DinB family protein [Rubricoccaceae bacterium]|jgi:uncharacterized damage-inducible protein DinB